MDISRRRLFASRAMSIECFRPPWSVAETLFLDRCTRCDDCLKACPTGLLQRGDGGFPVARFDQAACTFCGECARVCRAKAITDPKETPHPWNYGISIGAACLAQQGVECRVCGEVCEALAIGFKPRTGGMALPAVDDAACTGCGACIAPCPVAAIGRIEKYPVANAPVSNVLVELT